MGKKNLFFSSKSLNSYPNQNLDVYTKAVSSGPQWPAIIIAQPSSDLQAYLDLLHQIGRNLIINTLYLQHIPDFSRNFTHHESLAAAADSVQIPSAQHSGDHLPRMWKPECRKPAMRLCKPWQDIQFFFQKKKKERIYSICLFNYLPSCISKFIKCRQLPALILLQNNI